MQASDLKEQDIIHTILRVMKLWSKLLHDAKIEINFLPLLPLHLHHLALGKVPFWLVAVFAYVVSYTTSLFRNITPRRPHLLEKEGQPRQPINYSFADAITKATLSPQLFLRPWVLVRPESNSRPPAWQPDAQSTELPVRALNWKDVWPY